MLTITKGTEPASLTRHRRNRPPRHFDNYQDKDELRRELVREQRGLCCYCMERIRPDPECMKIEHWRSRSRYPDEELVYGNLLGACRGNEGNPPRKQHCDTKKGDEELKWNPACQGHPVEESIEYGADGTISSKDGEFGRQLNEVLNLNLPQLKNNRKAVSDGLLDWWKREKSRRHGRPVSRDMIERKRDRYTAGIGTLTPYCGVAVWWLTQKLEQSRRI